MAVFLSIKVTSTNIGRGLPASECACPLAFALTDTLNPSTTRHLMVSVHGKGIDAVIKPYLSQYEDLPIPLTLPLDVQDILQEYDITYKMSPFNFLLPLEEDYLTNSLGNIFLPECLVTVPDTELCQLTT